MNKLDYSLYIVLTLLSLASFSGNIQSDVWYLSRCLYECASAEILLSVLYIIDKWNIFSKLLNRVYLPEKPLGLKAFHSKQGLFDFPPLRTCTVFSH